MNLNVFLPTSRQHHLEYNNLRSQAMAGFCLFYLAVLCPLFFFSNQTPIQHIYGMIFVAFCLAAGLGSLLYLKKTGDFQRAGLFLCTFSVGIGILLSLQSEVAYTPSLFWLPFLISFMALLDGVRGSLAFAVLSLFFLVAYFLIAPRLGIPSVATEPQWTHKVLLHMVLSQLAFYAVIFVFESLRESDNRDVQRQKHRLMQSAKVQSTRSLNRLLEKKILACADANRQTINTFPTNFGSESKIQMKSLELLQRQLSELCHIADHFLDESRDKIDAKDSMNFMEELLREDPYFRLVDFQFKNQSESSSVNLHFHELYASVESGLELLIKPWRDVHNLRVMVEGEPAQDSLRLHLKAFVPQGGESKVQEIEAAAFSSLNLPHRLEINSTFLLLTLILPCQG